MFNTCGISSLFLSTALSYSSQEAFSGPPTGYSLCREGERFRQCRPAPPGSLLSGLHKRFSFILILWTVFQEALTLPLHMAKNKGKKNGAKFSGFNPAMLGAESDTACVSSRYPWSGRGIACLSGSRRTFDTAPSLTLRCPLRHQLTQHAI